MLKQSPLLMIALGSEHAPALSDLGRALGYPDAQITVGPMAEAIKALSSRSRSPDFIILDIAEKSRDILPDIDALAEHCEPHVNVVVIGSINDIGFYRDLKARGVLEYYPRPASAADIATTLIGSNQTRAKPTATTPGKVIATMSAASGDGSSTLAVNLAYCFAADHKQPTVLVDMDYQFGLIAKTLDLTAPFGTRELFEHPDRGLDDMLVQKMLVKYEENLSIISAPNELRLMPSIRPEVIEDMLHILRNRYKYVVVELPHVWTDWTAAVLKNSDQVMMVGQLWLRSLTHATRMLAAWQAAGIDRSKVSLVINRSGAKFKEAISAEEFERICNKPIDAHLNNDIKAVVNAENLGKTLIETGNGTILQQQFRDIAQSIIHRFDGTATTTTSSRRGLKSIFDKKASS